VASSRFHGRLGRRGTGASRRLLVLCVGQGGAVSWRRLEVAGWGGGGRQWRAAEREGGSGAGPGESWGLGRRDGSELGRCWAVGGGWWPGGSSIWRPAACGAGRGCSRRLGGSGEQAGPGGCGWWAERPLALLSAAGVAAPGTGRGVELGRGGTA
jgi:hypothetical protein